MAETIPPSPISLSKSQLASLIAVLVLTAKLLQYLFVTHRKNARLPPGPKGSLILGVTKEMLDPSVKPWHRFDQWAKEYNARKSLPTLVVCTLL